MNLFENKLKRDEPPFRADHVGSFLRPQRLKEARVKVANNEITAQQLKAIEDEEIRRVIANQKETGIRSITDGEFRRAWWHFDFMENLLGVNGFDADKGYSFHGVETKPRQVCIKERIAFNPEHPFLEHFKFLKKEVGASRHFIAKQTIPSPNMFMHLNIRQNEVYSSLDDYCADLAETYRSAIAAFYNAGCRYLQLDDVFWAYLSDERSHEKERAAGQDPEKIIDLCTQTLNMALKDKPQDMKITMHVCRGNFSSTWIYEGGYDKISRSLGAVNVDGLFLEYDDERSGGFAPLRFCKTQQVVLGLITTKTPELESIEKIKTRLHEATQFIELDRLCLSPQCGFASTEEGNHLSETQQWDKLKLVVRIADEVWGK